MSGRPLASVLAALAVAAVAAGVPAPALAASGSAGHLDRLLVVLVPHGHAIAVFEDAEFRHPVTDATVGLLDGAGPVSASVPLASRAGNYVVTAGTQPDAILRYSVPWNGRGGTLNLPLYMPAASLVVLTAPGLTVPVVLNPSLAPAGRVRFSSAASAPVFTAYATSGLAAGENVPVVVEAGSAAPVPVSRPAPQFPAVGRGFLAAALVVVLGALAWAFNWVPAVTGRGRDGAAVQWQTDLQDLEEARGRGEVPDGEYRLRRRALKRRLAAVGHGHE